MPTLSGVAQIAALVGDPARANMLLALMDGRALTATELARAAGVTPQTASGHLTQLTQAGLLAMERQGRHRYHRLAAPSVATMLESIMSLTAALNPNPAGTPKARPALSPRDHAIRRARTCYDHLAGEIAVAMAARMVERGHADLSPDGGALTAEGLSFLRNLGVDLAPPSSSKRTGRIFCRPCLDWTERRLHIAGTVGAALCKTCFDQGWIRRMEGTRAVAITRAGELALREAFDLRK